MKIAPSIHRVGINSIINSYLVEDAGEVTIIARHPVQRLDRAHHGQVRNELIVGVHQQLRPWAIHRHRLDSFAVGREPPVLDYPSALEQRYRLTVRDAVERYRELELVGRNAKVRTGESDTLGIARKLKLRFGWRERGELDVAIR